MRACMYADGIRRERERAVLFSEMEKEAAGISAYRRLLCIRSLSVFSCNCRADFEGARPRFYYLSVATAI